MTFYVSSQGGQTPLTKWMGGPWPDKHPWIRHWLRLKNKEKNFKFNASGEGKPMKLLFHKRGDVRDTGKTRGWRAMRLQALSTRLSITTRSCSRVFARLLHCNSFLCVRATTAITWADWSKCAEDEDALRRSCVLGCRSSMLEQSPACYSFCWLSGLI